MTGEEGEEKKGKERGTIQEYNANGTHAYTW